MSSATDPSRPRVALLRGHNANVWDLRPWQQLADEYESVALVTGSNLHQVDGLRLEVAPVRTPRDFMPAGRAAGAAAYLVGERYLGLEERLSGARIVHSAEIGTWFSAQAARLKARLGFKLVLTVWETIAWRDAYRWPRERAYRRLVLPQVDLFLPVTERARDCLLLEGVSADQMQICPPGIDTTHFAARPPSAPTDRHTILCAGRLVWEKGHHDVLRAFAALRSGLVGGSSPGAADSRLLIVGSGPEEKRLRRYADELGVSEHVDFRATVPYESMPSLYAQSSCLVLASLPTRGWEEQFGMVLAEAMAAGTPIVATDSGAIREVLGGAGQLVASGDWCGLAQALAEGPLEQEPVARATYDPALIERYAAEAAAARLRVAYRRVLSEGIG